MRFGVCLFLLSVLVGCSARGPYHVTPDTRDDSLLATVKGQAPTDSLAHFIEKVRTAAAEATPPERKPLARAEALSPQLTAAIAAAEASPSAPAYRVVASEYVRLGVEEMAHEYLDKAAAIEPRDSLTYQARARMWRNGGFPERALSDAHRAVYFAPLSAAAHSTLGTVLQALGRHAEARREYERAVALDPAAAYALNNLCYAWILERQPVRAIKACRAAVDQDTTLRVAWNNLGLAYASSGNIDAARAAFEAAGDRAAARYNLGVVQLARRRYADAVTAFAEAQHIRPNWRMAAVRARQAQKLANGGAEE